MADDSEGKPVEAGLDARQSMEHNARLLRWMPLATAVLFGAVLLSDDSPLHLEQFATTIAVLLVASLTAHGIVTRHRLAETARDRPQSTVTRLDWWMLALALATFLAGIALVVSCLQVT